MAPKKKAKVVDWAADENFTKDRSIFHIEHTTECPIFYTKAEECLTFFRERIPERQFQLVHNKNGKQVPRAGAFEVNFSQNARTSEHELWSGISKGPPRRDKFPKYEELVSDVHRVLKKFYPDKTVGDDDDDDMDMNM